MALRFQEKDDVDRVAKESRATGVTVFLLLVLAVITGAVDWFSGESLASYEKELVFYIGLAFVIWLAAPFYHEFRIRTKEIDGKVSAIDGALSSSREAHEELLERLTAIEERLEELSAINANDEPRRNLKRVPYQLECTRRLQQIEGDLRELRTNAATARFAKEGESGYIPKQSLGEDRWFTVPLDESEARSSTIWNFSYIEERLDKFVLPEYQGDPLDPYLGLIGLCIDLEHLQRSVREEARKSVKYSLNEIALAGVCLTNQLHEMLEQMDMRYKELERAKEIEDKRSERAQSASERA